MKSSQFSETK